MSLVCYRDEQKGTRRLCSELTDMWQLVAKAKQGERRASILKQQDVAGEVAGPGHAARNTKM